MRIELDAASTQEWPIRIPRHELIIERMTVDGVPASISGGEEFIEIPRSRSVEIFYSAHPTRGLEFSGKTLYSVFSTSYWMPCLEEPSVRAPLALTLLLPPSMEAVASGRLVSRSELPHEKQVDSAKQLVAWRFELETPYPSYLYGFAAGPFVRVAMKHGNVDLVAVGDGITEEKLRLLLEATAPMMDFFAERAGVPYPLQSYTQVVVPGDVAQEMAGFSVLGLDDLSEMLAIDLKLDATATPGVVEDWLPAHELSHAWWGNLITCRNWDHFWLNEGFAVFVTAAWKEHRWGESGYKIEMDRAHVRWKRAQDADVDHTLSYHGPYPTMGLRNCIVYSKGAIFLDELRRTLGDELFWRGVREYTRAQRGRSVVSDDFEKAMQHATGKDLRPLFQKWVDS